ncbi:MAG: peptide-methionine (S)-S-oxide reductase MsrA [Methanobrevibacter sp.]|nr:peptide-methionine (S)-S-oxide reductase MsrA [Methanobrevibacter sp.]
MINKDKMKKEPDEENNLDNDLKEIFLAGGCFWGIEAYISKIKGIVETKVGYANGKYENPSYEEVCNLDTGHSETVKIKYDSEIISLQKILEEFFKIIDPTSLNRQGGDIGKQYRTGIYYSDEKDLAIINKVFKNEQKKYKKDIVTEIEPIDVFYIAEEYHQKYLEKNPEGYCHVDLSLIPSDILKIENSTAELVDDYNFYECSLEKFAEKKEARLKKLSSKEYEITQNNATEAPFSGKYNFHKEEGIYVDVVSGEPLFTSLDKFESTCGWPSFAKPIAKDILIESIDTSYRMLRTELKSKIAKSHLGHVFDDGPKDMGGQRFCINSASLRFIPVSNMKKEGYEKYLSLFKKI